MVGSTPTPDGPTPSGRQSKPGKGLLVAAVCCAIVFLANIVIGKIAILRGATEAPGLGDVGEFLLLFVAVALFIGACLARERAAAADRKSGNQQ